MPAFLLYHGKEIVNYEERMMQTKWWLFWFFFANKLFAVELPIEIGHFSGEGIFKSSMNNKDIDYYVEINFNISEMKVYLYPKDPQNNLNGIIFNYFFSEEESNTLKVEVWDEMNQIHFNGQGTWRCENNTCNLEWFSSEHNYAKLHVKETIAFDLNLTPTNNMVRRQSVFTYQTIPPDQNLIITLEDQSSLIPQKNTDG